MTGEQGFARVEDAQRVLTARVEPLWVLTREYLGSSLAPEGQASKFFIVAEFEQLINFRQGSRDASTHRSIC